MFRMNPYRKARLFADLLLLIVATCFGIVLYVQSKGLTFPSLNLAQAFLEAALVGALADWFAVTALFYHPFGIPLPHTAIIPNNKEIVADQLGRFIQENFLSSSALGDYVGKLKPALSIAHWMQSPLKRQELSLKLEDSILAFVEESGEGPLVNLFSRPIYTILNKVELAPAVGRVAEFLFNSDMRRYCVDSFFESLGSFIQQNRRLLDGMIKGALPWYVPRFMHEHVFRKFMEGMSSMISSVGSQPDHPLRSSVEEKLSELIVSLQQSENLRQKGEELKRSLLESDWLVTYLKDRFSALGSQLNSVGADGPLSSLINSVLNDISIELISSQTLQSQLDKSIVKIVRRLANDWRVSVADFVANIVRSWSSETIVEKINAGIGADLQYIRVNGTIIGGLIGLVIHFLKEAVAR